MNSVTLSDDEDVNITSKTSNHLHCVKYLLSLLCPLVPPPTSVTITSDPVSPIRPVGSDVTLTCTVELSAAVDVAVTVNTVWTGPAGFMTTNTAQPVMGTTTTYTSTAMVSSFGRDQSGDYICAATVSPKPSSLFLIRGGSQLRIVNVTTGMATILLSIS